MDLECPKIPLNIIERCHNLWNLQKKLKELLSTYGTCLETLQINPHNNDARKNILSLINELNDVGKRQNVLLKELTGSTVQLSEKYFSYKSILLENFRDALIRQLWNNGMEQCLEEIDEEIVKILFLNQMNLIPGKLDECLNKANKNDSKTIEVGNIKVTSSVDLLGVMSNNEGADFLNFNKATVDEEKYIENVVQIEPRCTRSSKIPLKRNSQDDEIQTKMKSRRKMSTLLKKPNTCCSLCKKLVYISEETVNDNVMVICCKECNEKFYSAVTDNSHSSSNNEDPVTPSDISSPNDTSQDTSHSNNS